MVVTVYFSMYEEVRTVYHLSGEWLCYLEACPYMHAYVCTCTQGFNEELPKAVAHITQQLVEQGTFSDAYSVRILRHEKQILSTFGEWHASVEPTMEACSTSVQLWSECLSASSIIHRHSHIHTDVRA